MERAALVELIASQLTPPEESEPVLAVDPRPQRPPSADPTQLWVEAVTSSTLLPPEGAVIHRGLPGALDAP